MRHRTIVPGAMLIGLISTTFAFSASSRAAQQQQEPNPESSAIVTRKFIELNDPTRSQALQQQNRLPASFVATWPIWILELDGTITKIPDSDGFVPPTSIDVLWQPIDLKPPELRLAVGLHVRQGVIRHIMPAVDLAYKADDGQTLMHRNRGLNTVPLAHSWIDYVSPGTEIWDEYRLCLSKKAPEDEKWTMLHSKCSGTTGAAVERAIMCLAESPPDELAEGSHFIHVLLDEKASSVQGAVQCPNPGCELRVTMVHQDDIDDLEYVGDDSRDEASLPGLGILQIAISTTMPGSESENLPEAYRPLYLDESLRRPTYARFKERQEGRKKKALESETQ